MNWYYVDKGQQAGPVTDEQFAELRRTGVIDGNTLVWREGMANWVPLSELNTEPGTGTAMPSGIASSTNEAACTECGSIVAQDELIQHGSSRICVNCKPIFLQKLAEGAQINSGQLDYARILLRFAALFLDSLILWLVGMLCGLVAGLTAAQAAGVEPRGVSVLPIILFGVQLGIGISYEALMVGKYGATLGKMACKIKVVTADGGRVSYARAFGRYFARMLSAFTCLIGYLIAFWDPEKRTLHDRICDTRVINK